MFGIGGPVRSGLIAAGFIFALAAAVGTGLRAAGFFLAGRRSFSGHRIILLRQHSDCRFKRPSRQLICGSRLGCHKNDAVMPRRRLKTQQQSESRFAAAQYNRSPQPGHSGWTCVTCSPQPGQASSNCSSALDEEGEFGSAGVCARSEAPGCRKAGGWKRGSSIDRSSSYLPESSDITRTSKYMPPRMNRSTTEAMPYPHQSVADIRSPPFSNALVPNRHASSETANPKCVEPARIIEIVHPSSRRTNRDPAASINRSFQIASPTACRPATSGSIRQARQRAAMAAPRSS